METSHKDLRLTMSPDSYRFPCFTDRQSTSTDPSNCIWKWCYFLTDQNSTALTLSQQNEGGYAEGPILQTRPFSPQPAQATCASSAVPSLGSFSCNAKYIPKKKKKKPTNKTQPTTTTKTLKLKSGQVVISRLLRDRTDIYIASFCTNTVCTALFRIRSRN